MPRYSIGFDPVRKSNYCHHTFTSSTNLLRCAGCKFARYASKEAQRAAWKNGHQQECAALQACGRIPPATIRLAARIYWKERRLTGDGALPHSIESLQHHWDDLDDDRKQSYAQMAIVTREYMKGSGTSIPDAKDVAYLLARFACNNHTICDDELRPKGVGIFPLGAMLNHSCTPNTMQSFTGSRIVFRAVQHIPAGAEATIAYVELAATRAERRAMLKANYFFDIDANQELCVTLVPKEVRLDDTLTLELFERRSMTMDEHDPELTCVDSDTGSGANVVRVQAEECATFSDEETEAGPSQAPAGQKNWEVKVQCWGAAFLQGGNVQNDPTTQAIAVAWRLATILRLHASASDLVSQGQLEACDMIATALQSMQDMQKHIWRMRLLEVQLRAAIECGNKWDLALDAARSLLPFYTWLYPKVWPNLGLHLATLAKIAALLDHFDEAATHAEAAAAILRITHPEGQIVQDMLRLWHDASAELNANAEE
ncbi:g10397 [Coccomyxa elongata]